ncbi:hypothetical protein JG687_00007948 [Phytophthora cactorum]|uniref:M96 mating-specific protein family n=1 Tax=Phytophthora cactorum TaxID=29920 RepID=A0A8T1UDQ2_9STRA|nr:hypothetical protein JG687_00007948 [Phytophthora cactorum]
MAFQLLEEDDQTFTEVLALLDEYNAAVEEPAPPHTKHSSPFSRVSESAAWAAFEAAHPITENASKHRNGARELRRREVQFLRTCVKGLERQVNALKEGAEQRAQMRIATTGMDGSSALTTMWKDLATCQLEQRLVSERENIRLQTALEDHRKLREMLERALNTRVAKRIMETSLTPEKRTTRVHGVALDVSDQEVFEELEVGVDSVYHEAARVFFQAETGDGTCLGGVYGEKTLPFDLRTTADAAWRCLAHAFHHEKYNFSYSRERRKNDSSDVAHNDTVGESFGVEIKAPERMADFRIKQIFRRYVESDRVVIAWRSYIDPAEFKGQKLENFRFQEKGSCIVRHPSMLPNNDLTVLRIWHIITPESQSHSEEMDSEFVQDLTDFVLSGSSSANTVQMIENALIDAQSPRSCSNFTTMSFPLLDDETFTEVLALLDEYNAAIEEPLVPICNKPPSAFSRVSESAAWAAFEATHPITKNASKHRNGAREMRRREAMETSLIQEKRTRRVHGVPLEAADREVFQELEVEIDNVYREAANVFDTGEGTSLGVFGEKMLPFDVHTTAEAAWRCLAHAFQHEKCHFSYMRERRKDKTDEVAHDDTVGESFGVEIKAPERMAAFRIKQVFRRYVESEQIVIAWRSFIDTTEFKGQTLQSVRFLEKGSCVIRHPSKLQTSSDEFTLLRIWHVITPESQTRPENMSSEFVQGLTDFVLGVSSSASTVQTIEDMLIDGQCASRYSSHACEEHV